MKKLPSPSARCPHISSAIPACLRFARPARVPHLHSTLTPLPPRTLERLSPRLVLHGLYLNLELLLSAIPYIFLQLYFPHFPHLRHFPHYSRVSIAVSSLTATPPTPLYLQTPHHHFTAQQDGQGRSCRCRRRHWSGENELVELQDYSNRIQPLSLLLKQNQHVTELALYDVVNSPGVATDLSHISSPAVRANPHASHIHEQELTAGRKSQATCPRKMA